MAITKLNKTYVNNQTKLNAADFQQNVNKIDEIIEVTENRSTITQDVTMKSGYSLDNDRRYFVARNNSYDIDLMITSDSFPTTLTTIATISANYAPLRDLFFPIFADSNSGTNFQVAICRITTNGNIDVAVLNQNVKRVTIRHSWMK